MGNLKIYLSDDLETAFRKRAMEAFGYRKGSISRGAQAAIAAWLRDTAGEDGPAVV